MESFQRFICPVETCNRAFKSKRGWTVHLHTNHADLDLNVHENTIIDVPAVSLLPIQGDLRSSSPELLVAGFAVVDYPMSDAAQEYPSPLPSPGQASPEPMPVDGHFLPDVDSDSGSNVDYHPFINGNLDLHLLLIYPS